MAMTNLIGTQNCIIADVNCMTRLKHREEHRVSEKAVIYPGRYSKEISVGNYSEIVLQIRAQRYSTVVWLMAVQQQFQEAKVFEVSTTSTTTTKKLN